MKIKILNIGIIAHVDAGKTTLTESILYHSGVIHKKGRVDTGDTQTDSMPVERRRGISVKAAAASFNRNGVKFNFIDTPGHADFIAEVERSLSVLDGVILLIPANEGIQSQTRILMNTIMAQHMPAVIFINKMDRPGANINELIKEIGRHMNGRLIVTECADTGPDGSVCAAVLTDEELMERNKDILYTLDEGLLEQFINNETIPFERFFDKLTYYTRRGELYPVFFGSALYGTGVECLLDKLPVYLPEAGQKIDEPVSGLVFKVDNSSSQKLVYIRLYQGCVRIRCLLAYGGKDRGKEEKITKLSRLSGGKLVNCSLIEAGDIGVLYCRDMRVGDILGESCGKSRSIRLGRPTLSVEVKPEQVEHKRALYEALALLADEDPLLDITAGDTSNNNRFIVRLFGEIQMEILQELFLERYGIPVSFSDAITLYMETPLFPASSKVPMGKGHPFRAGVGFRVEPLARGSGIEYISEVWLGNLEKTFQRAVEEAVLKACKQGLYGWEITDVSIIFDFSEYDSVTSTPSDFRNLTPLVLMEAFAQAGMGLLEPVLAFDLQVPLRSASRALYDCKRMNAAVEKTIPIQGAEEELRISGIIPADACRGYGMQVASYTESKGMFFTRFHGYKNTDFDQAKVNEIQINPAANKTLYLLYKSGAHRLH